jgi:hypothetical protein
VPCGSQLENAQETRQSLRYQPIYPTNIKNYAQIDC